jgi:hypothetical protein
MIVKPLAGAGSQGVYIARDKETLVNTFKQLEGEVKANKFLAYVCLVPPLPSVALALSTLAGPGWARLGWVGCAGTDDLYRLCAASTRVSVT